MGEGGIRLALAFLVDSFRLRSCVGEVELSWVVIVRICRRKMSGGLDSIRCCYVGLRFEFSLIALDWFIVNWIMV